MMRTSMLSGRLRSAFSRLSIVCIVFWLILLADRAWYLRLVRASQSFPFRLFVVHTFVSALLLCFLAPEANMLRFFVVQGGGLAITVTYFGISSIRFTQTNNAYSNRSGD